ncbi:uncharacterized protein LOC128987923 [Macrosteles quadrilineatus]|uniref:uncharacterized protein LOC128987923 n=1 Tax=Macrosteles quadrilineatus TaxID=74068 RepID=UPI0023E18D5D|nr:uncharacterized protein LOC128987923 [Macrosteles quadrilineatus]XP_054264991.1 uncharacterized protein LOC128987923 [Macrosteles quadrilineatus]XP_054264992.1 uncharacterized protein LOC128987923 [Macrosteles quadrilineatus]
MTSATPTPVLKTNARGFCGCCSLQAGGIFTGVLSSVYNALLIYWFISSMGRVHSSDDNFLVVTVLLEVLIFLALVHIVVSVLLIHGVVKAKPDLVMLWVVVYISSCIVVGGLFTITLAYVLDKAFLFIIFLNFLFIFNVMMTLRLYREMIGVRDSV